MVVVFCAVSEFENKRTKVASTCCHCLCLSLLVLCAWFCCERPQTKTQGSCGFVFNHNAAKHHHSVHCWLIWTPFLLLVVLMNQTKDTLDVLCGFVGAVKILEQSNVLCVLWTRMQEQAYKLGNGRRVCVLSMFTVGACSITTAS